jgi:hypothetical protein
MVTGKDVVGNVRGGMMINGVFVLVDVPGVGVVTGKVAWFGGRVYTKDDGVILWTGLIL